MNLVPVPTVERVFDLVNWAHRINGSTAHISSANAKPLNARWVIINEAGLRPCAGADGELIRVQKLVGRFNLHNIPTVGQTEGFPVVMCGGDAFLGSMHIPPDCGTVRAVS